MSVRAAPRPSTTFVVSASLVVFWLIVALVGPWFAPHPPGQVVDLDVFSPPAAAYPLGSDYLGRDVLSRLLFATRLTVAISLVAAVIAMVAGVFCGLVAASGGWLDGVLSKLFDTISAVPSLMFGLVVIASLGSLLLVLIGTITGLRNGGVAHWFGRGAPRATDGSRSQVRA